MSFNRESEEDALTKLEANLELYKLHSDESEDEEDNNGDRKFRHGVGYQDVVLTAEQIKLKEKLEGKRHKMVKMVDSKENEEEESEEEEFSRVKTILESINSKRNTREDKIAKRLKA